MPITSPRDRARIAWRLPERRVWVITVTGVRASNPRLRTTKAYRLRDARYHDAADCARRLAHMAGLVAVTIIGSSLTFPDPGE